MSSKENKIIEKYSLLVERAFEEYNDKTMGELWKELDKLKKKMGKELRGCKSVK